MLKFREIDLNRFYEFKRTLQREAMEKENLLYGDATKLAFMGDAVYEASIREHIFYTKNIGADKLHRLAVSYVNAGAQAGALKSIIPYLHEEEMTLIKRARNKKITSKPKNADPITYKWATAFEALLGYLYLSGEKERLTELIGMAISHVDAGGLKNGKKGKKEPESV